jgi:hypothetical protein
LNVGLVATASERGDAVHDPKSSNILERGDVVFDAWGAHIFALLENRDQGCHTGRPEAFWRANRAGGRAALSITPYMNRAGYCRR